MINEYQKDEIMERVLLLANGSISFSERSVSRILDDSAQFSELVDSLPESDKADMDSLYQGIARQIVAERI